jgi:hypothetical protein
MSHRRVPAALRRLVVARAEGICEYCLISLDDTYYAAAVDHIVSQKHGGPTVAENLALSCLSCNSAKGTDLGSIEEESEDLVGSSIHGGIAGPTISVLRETEFSASLHGERRRHAS